MTTVQDEHRSTSDIRAADLPPQPGLDTRTESFAATDRFDRGDEHWIREHGATAAQAARVLSVRNSNAAVALATRLLGNPGLARGNPLERHFRDIQFAAIHAPQEDVILRQLGTAVLEAAAPQPATNDPSGAAR